MFVLGRVVGAMGCYELGSDQNLTIFNILWHFLEVFETALLSIWNQYKLTELISACFTFQISWQLIIS